MLKTVLSQHFNNSWKCLTTTSQRLWAADEAAQRRSLPVVEVAITQRRVDVGQLINTIGFFFFSITAPLNLSPGDELE